MSREKVTVDRTGLEVAVIGMAGRFPGAANCSEFWENIKNGVESITFFSNEELEAEGLDPETLENPNYVKASGLLREVEYFDASFFGYTPKEAELMDPQLRLFHECSWQALEDAGYVPGSYDGLIGIYAGASSSMYWEVLTWLSGKRAELGEFAAGHFSNKDFISTRVAYKLNLKGPAQVIQSTCSTSLAAIHQACRAVLSGECHMALAGGVTVSIFQKKGYMYQEGMIASPDGHCRAFDARAKGTIGGNGAAIVTLKRLKNAIADNDHIYAVIKGSAVNNDGSQKIGFTAPSVQGQAEVIQTAMAMARVAPETISYVETHGTGTQLGDPVEIEALTEAFQSDKKQYCAIGSVKTNIGHLDIAAGAAGFIKAVLALTYKQIPPSINYETPNPKIDFENSPFYVVTKLTPWKRGEFPLRAGVSSFGIGGTNVHVVLEEWSYAQSAERKVQSEKSRPYQLMLLSAKTETALEQMTQNLAHYFKQNPYINLADAAYTLQVGRQDFRHRKMMVCSSVNDLINPPIPQGSGAEAVFAWQGKSPSMVFMFPGQGSQYINMGRELYEHEPIFRETMDRCFEILQPLMGYDIKEILYPGISSQRTQSTQRGKFYPKTSASSAPSAVEINQTEVTQPLIFAIEYALAKLLMHWGIKPQAMIGHSIGEYTAACLAGVFSLGDALKLVTIRGKLMQQMPAGAMLSLSLPGEEVKPLLNDRIALAAVNSPSRCVVSGPCEAIGQFEEKMKHNGYEVRRLHTSHAFHSSMMEPILEKFAQAVKQIQLNKPQIPYMSNISGQYITDHEAQDPAYWAAHLRRTVKFAHGLEELAKQDDVAFLEVGPGNVLGTFARQCNHKKTGQLILTLLRHPKENIPDIFYLLKQVGWLWLRGVKIDWQGFYGSEERRRVSLPPYPFEGQYFQAQGDPFAIARSMPGKTPGLIKNKNVAQWFYIPSWKRSPLAVDAAADKTIEITGGSNTLVFANDDPLSSQLVKQLQKKDQGVVIVKTGKEFVTENQDLYRLNPGEESHYDTLFQALGQAGLIPGQIFHLWSLPGETHAGSPWQELENIQDTGYYSLLNIARAIGKHSITGDIRVHVISSHLLEVNGEEVLLPVKATLLGPVKVIPLEYPNVRCQVIDILYPGPRDRTWEHTIEQLLTESTVASRDTVIAYRGNYRWVQTFEPLPLEKSEALPPIIRKEGVYLVTGGLGGIGLTLAQHLAEKVNARLILVGRSAFPHREEWDQWLAHHDKNDSTSKKIEKIRQMEAGGTSVLAASADVTDDEQMKTLINLAQKQFGTINGVIHAAGIGDYAGVIQKRTREMSEHVLAAKVKGTLVLEQILKDHALDFFVLCSSTASIQAPFGQVAYCAANVFLDAFALAKSSPTPDPAFAFTVSINWDSWQEVGMAVEAVKQWKDRKDIPGIQQMMQDWILPGEGIDVFQRILHHRLPQVIVSPMDLKLVLELPSILDTKSREEPPSSELLNQRPELSTQYTAPTGKLEQTLTGIWQTYFGLKSIGIHDNFFELGGDSLLGMRLLNIYKELVGEVVPITVIFEIPTIAELTAYFQENYPQAVKKITGAEEGRNKEYGKHDREKDTIIEPAEEKEYYLLSSAQKRLYLLQQMDDDGIGYNMPKTQPLGKNFHRMKIQEVFHKLIRRHESFRTSFQVVNEEPVQRIQKSIPFEMEYYDLEPGHEGAGQQMEDIVENFVRPFDLSRAPLLRAALIKTAGGNFILMVDMHHIICDGVSDEIFTQEFMALYPGNELTPLKLQYKDYSEWQNRTGRNNQVLKRQEAFWLKELGGELPILNLPTDYARPEIQSFAGAVLDFHLGIEETRMLRKIALEQGGTLYMAILALFNILLSKLSGQEDILVGTAIAGRKHADLDRVIGMFVNTLVLRNFPAGDKIFKQFLKELITRTIAAFENQDYQFGDLVNQVIKNRDVSRNPLFDVMFSFEVNEPGPRDQSKKNQKEEVPKDSEPEEQVYYYKRKTTRFDLIFTASDMGDHLFFFFEYCTKLFKEETISKFIRYFQDILSAVIENPDIQLKDIRLSHGLLVVEPDSHQANQIVFDF